MINTLTEDEDYQVEWCKENYLTLADLHELAEREPYKHSWDYLFSDYLSNRPIYDEKNDLYYYTDWTRGLSIVHRHLLVEEYMSKPFSQINWKLVTNYYSLYTIRAFINVYTHPLAWISESQFPSEYIILGKMAKEVSNYEPYDGRMGTAWEWFNQIISESILCFVDRSLVYAKDDIKNGVKKGLHRWDYIMAKTDEDLFNHMFYEHNLSTFNDGLLYFDIDAFQRNIQFIERMRGGDMAARVIRRFQKEWEEIELWDAFCFSKYPKDHINKFKLFLFRGFEKDLEKWEGSQTREIPSAKSTSKSKSQTPSDNQSFNILLQCQEKDKEKVMARLHELLDGKGGKQVALILAAAKYKYHYIISIPTEKQYRSEFQLNGTWKAVSSYIKARTTANGEFTENIDHLDI